ncbi:hypothetical protein HOLleu_29996 [Holothuria leucospilota]|uniref:Uncharacterized protein n=1 Tax=Holothuria leucospilota TaxID=206669 RepID=A0A9Q1BJV6_HOLLE|nr:hypothetical protein HOLleu_29996 [Holothuria leucospilota]
MNRLTMQFNTCHALARHAGPFTDYVWQNTLDSLKGLDVGTSYRNDHAAQIFTHYIARNEQNKRNC